MNDEKKRVSFVGAERKKKKLWTVSGWGCQNGVQWGTSYFSTVPSNDAACHALGSEVHYPGGKIVQCPQRQKLLESLEETKAALRYYSGRSQQQCTCHPCVEEEEIYEDDAADVETESVSEKDD